MPLRQDDRDRIEDLGIDPTGDRTEVTTATQRRLDGAAERAWERMQNCPLNHPQRDMLRDLAFAAKDRADAFARSEVKGPGSAATDSEPEVPTNTHEGSELP